MIHFGYEKDSLKKDIPAGLVAALISIPISMGYAQVAGLPAIYGLYGSVLPTVVFGLLTSSKHFYFGVDAAPAALTGSMIASMGIATGSDEALKAVATVTLMTTIWLVLFALIDFGRAMKFISKPVMGGFVTGVCCEIILMQVPRLFGGSPGHGKLPELLSHILEEWESSGSAAAFAFGIGTILLIAAGNRLRTKIPAPVILLLLSIFLEPVFHISRLGVPLFPAVERGIHLKAVRFSVDLLTDQSAVLDSLTIALVILSESLLATIGIANKYDEKLNKKREVWAYAAANAAGLLTGCCPTNGSPSRSALLEKMGSKTQMVSLVSGAAMLGILFLGTGIIQYLPVPVMTGIVISSLYSATEFSIAKELRKVDPIEFLIFWAVLLSVLLIGVVQSVFIGIILSCLTVIGRQSNPNGEFLGVFPGRETFVPVRSALGIRPLAGVVIYQFQAPLFFANAEKFRNEVEAGMRRNTRILIIDARSIGSVDVSAAEQLMNLYHSLRRRGISFYFTGQPAEVNTQLRNYGAAELFRRGVILPDIRSALLASGIRPPYKLEEPEENAGRGGRRELMTAVFEWAYGEDAEKEMKLLARKAARRLLEDSHYSMEDVEKQLRSRFGAVWSELEEDDFFELLQMYIVLLSDRGKVRPDALSRAEDRVIGRQVMLDREVLLKEGREGIRKMLKRRAEREERFRKLHPESAASFDREREKYRKLLNRTQPYFSGLVREILNEAAEGSEEPDDPPQGVRTDDPPQGRENAEHNDGGKE